MPENNINSEETSSNNPEINDDSKKSSESKEKEFLKKEEENESFGEEDSIEKIDEEEILPLLDNPEINDSEKSSENEEKESLRKEDSNEKINEEEISPVPFSNVKSLSKESNYQISLIDVNLLRVIVTTKKGVKINSSVKEKKTAIETQSNEIYLYPKIDFSFQEVEILISIEEELKEKNTESIKVTNGEPDTQAESIQKSNYQINLINENLLKIKLDTERGIKIDSISREKKSSIQTQSNRIYLQPKSQGELQEIEIIVAIDIEEKDLKEKFLESGENGKIKLIPNPEVVDLIQTPDYSNLSPYSTDEYTNTETRFKNPFDALRKLIKRNLTIGIAIAVALHVTVAGIAFYSLGKKPKSQEVDEQSRLIVIQDLPDPKIKLEDVEDPNKPKIEEALPIDEPERIDESKREIPPRKIVKPPIVTRPKREREDAQLDSSIEANLTRELDSLRKSLADLEKIDTLAALKDTNKLSYEIPDSLRNSFNENDIGLAMYFPKNWKLTDQREINKNEKEFKGVVLTDTTAEQPGTMTMFIFLDNENKDYNAEDFKTEFKMNDSTLTAFVKEPKTLAGFTEYRFYIFNKLGTEKLSLRASVRKQFFDQYKNEIEAVVRSISIKKKEDL